MAEQNKEQREENIQAGGKQCSWPECEWVLHPKWEERASTKGDFVYWADTRTANMSFAHRHNLGWRGGVEKGSRSNGRKPDSRLSKLVIGELEAGGATHASLAIARVLLELASGKHGAAAISALDRLSQRLGERPPTQKRPGPKEKCSVCGRLASGAIVITMRPDVVLEQKRLMQNLMDAVEDGEE